MKGLLPLILLLAVHLLLASTWALPDASTANYHELMVVRDFVVKAQRSLGVMRQSVSAEYELLLKTAQTTQANNDAVEKEIQYLLSIINLSKTMKDSKNKEEIITLLQQLVQQLAGSVVKNIYLSQAEIAKQKLDALNAKLVNIEAYLKEIDTVIAEILSLRTQLSSMGCVDDSSSQAYGSAATVKTADPTTSTTLATFVPGMMCEGAIINSALIIRRPVQAPGLNAGCVATTAKISANGPYYGIYFVVGEHNQAVITGISHSFTRFAYASVANIDFGFSLTAEGEVSVIEQNAVKFTVSRYAAGDRFTVEYRNGQFEYTQNEETIYTTVNNLLFNYAAFPVVMLSGAATVRSLYYTNARPSVYGTVAAANDMVEFREVLGVSAVLGKVVKSAPSSAEWWGAASAQGLTVGSGVSGIEFAPRQGNMDLYVGLSYSFQWQEFSNIEYMIKFTRNGYVEIVENAVTKGTFMAYTAGEKYSIIIDELGTVSYRKHNAVFYTSTKVPTSSKPLYVVASIKTFGAGVDNMKFISVPAAEHIIEVDAPVTFTSLVGIVASQGKLTKVLTADSEASAFSVASFDGSSPVQGVTFRAGQYNMQGALGLSPSNKGFIISYSLSFKTDNTFAISEKGIEVAKFAAYSTSDVFSIVIKDNKVLYLKNNAVFYTSATAPTFPLYVDVSIVTRSAHFDEVRFIGPFTTVTPAQPKIGDQVYFTNINSVLVGPGLIQKVSDDESCKAGAFSVYGITKTTPIQGIEFTCKQSNYLMAIGLSNKDGFADNINYAILCSSGVIKIIESTVQNIGADLGTYNANDRLGVRVNQYGQIEFTKNGNVIHVSQTAPTFPLYVDSALCTSGSTIDDIRFVGAPTPVVQQLVDGSPVVFRNQSGVITKDGNMMMVATQTGWHYNIGAVGGMQLSADGVFNAVEFTMATNEVTAVALSPEPRLNQAAIDYPFFLRFSSNIVFMSGVTSFNPGFTDGDKFIIAVNDGKVQYLKNGALFLAQPLGSIQQPLYVLVVEYFQGSILKNIVYRKI